MGLDGKIDRLKKTIPKEILEYKGALNHMAANLNQITKKINGNMILSNYDSRTLFDLEKLIKEHIKNVEKYFQ